jgi:hypothetical protein
MTHQKNEPLCCVSRGKTGEADTEKRDWTKSLRDSLELTARVMLLGMR